MTRAKTVTDAWIAESRAANARKRAARLAWAAARGVAPGASCDALARAVGYTSGGYVRQAEAGRGMPGEFGDRLFRELAPFGPPGFTDLDFLSHLSRREIAALAPTGAPGVWRTARPKAAGSRPKAAGSRPGRAAGPGPAAGQHTRKGGPPAKRRAGVR